jgi:hypothetical protein
MAEFSNQGTLSLTGTALATGTKTVTGVLDKVMIMRFNNPLAYSIQLYRFEFLTSTTTLIYDLSLAAGDTVTDNLTYALNDGDQLIAYSNIPGTTYYTYGLNY